MMMIFVLTLTVLSLTVPLLHVLQPNGDYFHRLVVLFLTFSPLFVILTISFEGLFYVAFCITLVCWIRLEDGMNQYLKRMAGRSKLTVSTTGSIQPGEDRALTLSDARIALFFLFFIQSAFFSTGNIASISSFSLDSVYRLIPVFNPFSQGALLVFKILIPFVVVSANLGILNRLIGVAPSALFMLVMAVGDIMTLTFFFMVRDQGSWLDIGTSISHYCIASLSCVFVAALEGVSQSFVLGLDVIVANSHPIVDPTIMTTGSSMDHRQDEEEESSEPTTPFIDVDSPVIISSPPSSISLSIEKDSPRISAG